MRAILTTSWISALALLVVASPDMRRAVATPPMFLPGQAVGQLDNALINEASGLAASRMNNDVFWVHNDSGDGSNVYAMNSTGTHLGVYRLSGASSSDWEDMAIGPGPVSGQSYLYLADIGDNNAVRSTIRVHRVVEPTVTPQQTPVDVTLSDVETFTLQYPDGPRDAETLMVDPLSGDIYIVSKRDAVPHIYRASYPQSTSDAITLESVGLLSWTVNSFNDWPTAGDISPDGDEVLIRSYVGATLWSVPAGTSLRDALAMPGYEVPLVLEPQGEAIAFDANGQNYYSVSEGSHQPIYFYERVPAPGDFDADGDVDGADFMKWQRGESHNSLSQSELDDWQEYFGTTASPIAVASTNVPEPATGILLFIGMATLLTGRKRRKR